MKHKKSKSKHSDKISQEEDQADANNSMTVEDTPVSKKHKGKHKDKERTRDAEDIKSKDLESTKGSKKDRKLKDKHSDAVNDAVDTENIQLNDELPSSSKNSAKDKKKRKSEHELVSHEVEESFSEKKSKKRKKSKSEPVSVSNGEELSPKKKSKKEKKKQSEESSLGVIDTDILKQAETNLGLPMADEPNKESAMQDKVNGDTSTKKSKKKKKDKEKKVEAATPNEKTRNERVLEYLREWNTNRKSWKFNKMLQVHLLHIMYDTASVNAEDFEVVLLYLYDLKGKGREKTREDAKKIIDREEVDIGLQSQRVPLQQSKQMTVHLCELAREYFVNMIMYIGR